MKNKKKQTKNKKKTRIKKKKKRTKKRQQIPPKGVVIRKGDKLYRSDGRKLQLIKLI